MQAAPRLPPQQFSLFNAGFYFQVGRYNRLEVSERLLGRLKGALLITHYSLSTIHFPLSAIQAKIIK